MFPSGDISIVNSKSLAQHFGVKLAWSSPGRSSPSAAAVKGSVRSELRETPTRAGLPSAGLDRLRVEVGLGLGAVDAVNAGGAAGGLVDAGAAVLGAAAGGGAQHGEGALTAVSARGLALGQSTVGVARGAAGVEAGDGWED